MTTPHHCALCGARLQPKTLEEEAAARTECAMLFGAESDPATDAVVCHACWQAHVVPHLLLQQAEAAYAAALQRHPDALTHDEKIDLTHRVLWRLATTPEDDPQRAVHEEVARLIAEQKGSRS